MTDSPQRIIEYLALYRRTHYDAVLPDGTRVTLRIGAPAPLPIVDWIGADRFAVFLSACNPQSHPLTPAENRVRTADLRLRLRATNARWLEGEGAIRGERWSEPSLLVAGLALESIDALARHFDQNAAVRVDTSAPVRLRLYRDWPVTEHRADIEHEHDR